MGLDNPVHIIFLLILLLLVFGAKRLPEMGRSLGSGMRGFKDSLSGEDARPTPADGHAVTPAAAQVVAPVAAQVAPIAAPVPESVGPPPAPTS